MRKKILLLFLPMLPLLSRAEVPFQIYFQARFASSGPLPTLEFRIVDSPSSDAALFGWSESTQPFSANGNVSLALGLQTPIPRAIFTTGGADRYLWVKVGSGAPARQKLVTVPYAFQASMADELTGGTTVQGTLSVAGTVRSTAGGFQFPDGSVQATASAGTGGVQPSDDITWSGLNTWLAPATFQNSSFSVGGSTLVVKGGSVGIGIADPEAKLHVNGSIFLEIGPNNDILMRRSDMTDRPLFHMGRIIPAGDGDPEFRFLYSDDVTTERSVLEFDKKGIVASVKPALGSHFEGFIGGDAEPLFRLNSSPAMQLEMGPGGTTPTDVAVRRIAANTIGFFNRAGGGDPMQTETMRIDGGGNVGIGTGGAGVINGRLHVKAGNDHLILEESDGPTDEQKWVVKADGGQFHILTANDAYTAFTEALRMSRTGSNLDSVSFPSGNVGVGTTAPNAKLHVSGGDAAVTTQGNGLILRATDGPSCFRITVNSAGTLSADPVACP